MHIIIPYSLQKCFNSEREIALNFHTKQHLDNENLQLNSSELCRHIELQPTFEIYTILHVPQYFLVMPEALLRIDARLLLIIVSLVLPLLWICQLGCRHSHDPGLPNAFPDTAEAALRTPGRKDMAWTMLRDSLMSFCPTAEVQLPCSITEYTLK